MDKKSFSETLVDLYALSIANEVLNKFDFRFRNEVKVFSSLSSDDIFDIYSVVFKLFKDEISERFKNLL